jgi:hypothetical protein
MGMDPQTSFVALQPYDTVTSKHRSGISNAKETGHDITTDVRRLVGFDPDSNASHCFVENNKQPVVASFDLDMEKLARTNRMENS